MSENTLGNSLERPQKVLVVTYNAIDGLPFGRVERGNVIAYSGDWSGDDYAQWSIWSTLVIGAQVVEGREVQRPDNPKVVARLSEAQRQFAADLPFVHDAYVYVGLSAMHGALKLIEHLKTQGKVVHMMACRCDEEIKRPFAANLGIELIPCECSGTVGCASIVKLFAEPVPAQTT